MNYKSKILSILTIALSLTAFGEVKSYSKDTFDTAMKMGDSIVVDFHANWCPVCKKQEPLIKEILSMKEYEKFVALKADFDVEKDLKKSLGVSKQSTIVVFKGGKEVGRKTGLTSKEEIKNLIDMGM